jgi:TPR repeat protein
MCYVGECYQDGVGVAKNRGLAKLWCERALQGNVDKVTERSNILLRTMARADAALLDPP